MKKMMMKKKCGKLGRPGTAEAQALIEARDKRIQKHAIRRIGLDANCDTAARDMQSCDLAP